MGYFIHNADGLIFIGNDQGAKVQMSFDDFKRMETGYNLPTNGIGREYKPGSHNLIFKKELVNGEYALSSVGDVLTWNPGDLYISRIKKYQRIIRMNSGLWQRQAFKPNNQLVERIRKQWR